MFAKKINLNVKAVVAQGKDEAKKTPSRGYQAPELHDVGKAIVLVQGGGGGNYLDGNRTRYY